MNKAILSAMVIAFLVSFTACDSQLNQSSNMGKSMNGNKIGSDTTSALQTHWDKQLGINIPDGTLIYLLSISRDAIDMDGNKRVLVLNSGEVSTSFNSGNVASDNSYFDSELSKYKLLSSGDLGNLKSKLSELEISKLPNELKTPSDQTIMGGSDRYLFFLDANGDGRFSKVEAGNEIGRKLEDLLYNL